MITLKQSNPPPHSYLFIVIIVFKCHELSMVDKVKSFGYPTVTNILTQLQPPRAEMLKDCVS